MSRPEPPYYAVIFSSQFVDWEKSKDYAEVSARMEALAREQPGYLGMESARGEDGFGITVSYWESLEAVAAFKRESEHLAVQQTRRWHFYKAYEVRVALVERAYGGPKDRNPKASADRLAALQTGWFTLHTTEDNTEALHASSRARERKGLKS